MSENFALTIQNMKKKQLAMEIKKCNEITMKYGVTLSDTQIENLINKINIAIRDNKHLIHYGIQILKYMFSNKINFEYDIIFKVALK